MKCMGGSWLTIRYLSTLIRKGNWESLIIIAKQMLLFKFGGIWRRVGWFIDTSVSEKLAVSFRVVTRRFYCHEEGGSSNLIRIVICIPVCTMSSSRRLHLHHRCENFKYWLIGVLISGYFRNFFMRSWLNCTRAIRPPRSPFWHHS
jgi:hypothetical protein